jgi:hypothetical protein
MGSSRHPVNPVKLSQLALLYGFAGLLMLGTIPCSRSASMLIPTDVLYALSSMILLLGPARLCLSWSLVSCHEFMAKRALRLSEALCPCSIPNRWF